VTCLSELNRREDALTAGQLWAWIRGKAPADEAAVIAEVEAQPTKPSAPDKVTAVLKYLLDGRPEPQAELEALLDQVAPTQAVS
jgi:hypothetical protein